MRGFILSVTFFSVFCVEQRVLANPGGSWDQALNEQKFWAYPYGVIIQITIDKLSISDLFVNNEQPKKNSSEEAKSAKEARELVRNREAEIAKLKRILVEPLRQMEGDLEVCIGRKRIESVDLKSSKRNIGFSLGTKFAVTGLPMEIDLVEMTGVKSFTECVAKAMVTLQAVRFPARMMGTSVALLLRIDVRFLTDEEAMGRGYQYQMAEDQWKKAYSEQNLIWKQCKSDGDCLIVNLNCEVDAINKASVADYEAKALKRRKPPCEPVGTSKKIQAKCRRGKCQVMK